ncbi:MAG: hypothetical protein IKN71_04825 [Alphaproteobacteria bacterium]|nr:hypothetical protein [Alphaproteobacteria bacterium]
MEQILTKREKLRYVHWCIWPGIFWLISPWFWVSAILTGLICSLTLEPAISFYHSLPLQATWYGNAIGFLMAVTYAVLCTFIAYGSVYACTLLYLFFFDKDKDSQEHFKRYHLQRRLNL